MKYDFIQYSTIQYKTIQYNAKNTIQCYTMQHNTTEGEKNSQILWLFCEKAYEVKKCYK